MFLPDDVVHVKVTEPLNRFTHQSLNKKARMNEKVFKLTDTTGKEMKIFLTILMLMGVGRLPDIRLY